jgi:uracil DNA glycosylase
MKSTLWYDILSEEYKKDYFRNLEKYIREEYKKENNFSCFGQCI